MNRTRILFPSMLLCVLTLVAPAQAQFKANLQGTVTDSSGATVVGAKISIANQDTGLNRETATQSGGFYRISLLSPGQYTVVVENAGFKKFTAKDVVIAAEETRGYDVVLQVGGVQESVTVTAEADTLQTESANTAGSITERQIQRLPQVGRDPFELLRLAPGVFGDGARQGNGNSSPLPNSSGPGGSNRSIFQIENQVQVVANGQRTASNNFTVDGVSVNSLNFGGATVITPGQDSIQELSVVSNSYSAEDGRGAGAQVKVVSKTGSDRLHGSGFFKYQDPNWNAFNAFHGASGDLPSRVNTNFRQFGGSLGGPILKSKLFYFFSYEGLRSNNSDTSNVTWVETSDFRQRVSAARPDSVTAAILTSAGVEPRIANAIDTATCATAGIPSDATHCQVVSGGLDVGSVTGATGEYVSLDDAHFAGGGLDGNPDIQLVQLALPGHNRGDQYHGRIDFTRGNDQFAFGIYVTRSDNLGADAGGRSRPQGDVAQRPQNQTESLSWIRTLSPTLLNEARLNFTRFGFNQVVANSNVNFGIPRIEIEGYNFDRIRFGADRSETTPAILIQNTINFRDKVSKVIRQHALDAGFELTAEQDNNNLLGGARPLYSNVRLWNFANDAPIFEAINADPRSGGPAAAQRYLRSRVVGAFLQDSWKVRPNLTLTLGVRYEYYPPLSDKNHQLSNLIIGPTGLQDPQTRVTSVSSLIKPDRNNFAPRIGFAWSPGVWQGKTVVRGGFGVAYNRTDDVLFGNARGNPPSFARFNLCCGTAPTDFGTPYDNGLITYVMGTSNSATSYPINAALGSGIDPDTGGVCINPGCVPDANGNRDIPVEIYGGSPSFRNAYVDIYSLDVQQELPFRLIYTIGYQGSVGHKLTRLVNQNFLQPTNRAFFATYFPTSDVNSNFNALSARLRRAFARGYQFDFYYRFSKSIDQLSNEGPGAQTNQTDPARPQNEHGPSDFDATHYFTLTGIWDLPLFRGRNDWIGKVAGGWQVNGILSAHSGFPWTPVTGQLSSVPITGADTINPTRPTALLQSPGRSTSNHAFLAPDANFPGIVRNFNCDPNNGPLQGSPYFDICDRGEPGIGRNSFRGPTYFGLDFSVAKEFGLPGIKVIGEGAKIELRGNFFNAFNKLNLQPITFGSDQARIENSRFGQTPGGFAGRVIEFQARLTF